MLLFDCDVCVPCTLDLSKEQKLRKTKIATKIVDVTCKSNTTFKVKRSKVKVTRSLYSAWP